MYTSWKAGSKCKERGRSKTCCHSSLKHSVVVHGEDAGTVLSCIPTWQPEFFLSHLTNTWGAEKIIQKYILEYQIKCWSGLTGATPFSDDEIATHDTKAAPSLLGGRKKTSLTLTSKEFY